MIQLKNVSKKYSSSAPYSVKNLSLHIPEGEVFGFLGPNGAGKTTTMKMMLGLLTPTEGEILINGYSPKSQESKQFIGFFPENAHLYKYLTAQEFLFFCGEIFGIPKDVLEMRIADLLERLQFPAEAVNRPIGGYSKGMMQRIGLAQALINDPKIVFLDEPMSGLDPLGRRQVKDLILSLKAQGKTIFFNSHILNDAEVLCDRVGIIRKGELVLLGSVAEVTEHGKKSLEDVFLEVVTG
ncbi:MAG: ABC transporter ATP-binding protein [Candidatus Peregrinibacteria bacterium]